MQLNLLPNWLRHVLFSNDAAAFLDRAFDRIIGLGLALSSAGFALAIAIQFWNAA